MSIATAWGTTTEERLSAYPCDRLLPDGEALYRGVTIHARASVVFRWLCQLRVAPYSYDWLDNRGRRSPRELTPGLENLAVGQTVMGSFDLVDFERDRHLTLRLRPGAWESRWVRDVAVTYAVLEQGAMCRLLVKVILQYPEAVLGWVVRQIVAWGDLVMMRKQLLNFKRLAETS